MPGLVVTKHAESRLQQRSIKASDIDLALTIGTEVEDGVVIREKDYQRYERDMKRKLDRARNLVGKRLVIDNDRLITAYHASHRTFSRLLRD